MIENFISKSTSLYSPYGELNYEFGVLPTVRCKVVMSGWPSRSVSNPAHTSFEWSIAEERGTGGNIVSGTILKIPGRRYNYAAPPQPHLCHKGR